MLTTLKTERVNFLTHAIAALVWLPFTGVLVWFSAARADLIIVCIIYGIAATGLFTASALYHRYKSAENQDTLLRKFDHIAIFFMIAGTYTPTVWLWFDDPWRWYTLAFQWSVTLAGLVYNLFAPKRIRWLETALYLAMGWVVVYAIKPLFDRMPLVIFLDMAFGGLAYTVGALIYAFKKPNPLPGVFGFHELFHVLIIVGAGFHYSLILRSILL